MKISEGDRTKPSSKPKGKDMTFQERIQARIEKRQELGLSADEMQAKETADAEWKARRLPQLCQLIIQANVNGESDAKYYAEYKSLGGK
jgi:hypothetical protein